MEGKQMNLTEKRKSGKTIYEGNIIRLEKDVAVLPDGREAVREVVRHPGGVGVVAVDRDGLVCMVRQFRYPFMAETLEIPAGKLDGKGEDTFAAGKRELLEETGLTANKMELLCKFYASPGFCDEQIALYLATDLEQGVANPDDDEFLMCEKFTFDRLMKMIEDGELKDGKTVLAILMAKERLAKNGLL